MRFILEILGDKTVKLIYRKAGTIRQVDYPSISQVDLQEIKNKEIVLIVPDSLIITKSTLIPVDISSILTLKSFLIKSLPVNLNEIYNDYTIVGNKLYFIGIKRSSIEEELKIISRVKSNIKAVLPKSFALKMYANLNSPSNLAVNFSEGYLSIFCFDKAGYYFFVVLPYGVENFVNSEDEIQISRFINEIYRIISSFQSQTKVNIENFYIFVNKEYKELPVLSYFSRAFTGLNLITADDKKYEEIYSFILDTKDFEIDLSKDKIEEQYKKQEFIENTNRSLNLVLVVIFVLIILSWFVTNDNLNRRRMTLEALKNNYESQRISIQNTSQQNQKQDITDQKSLPFYEIFKRLNQASYSYVYLENFEIKDQKLIVSLISRKYSNINYLISIIDVQGVNKSVEQGSENSIGNQQFIKSRVSFTVQE
ncbi:MAG: hypothetical protein ABDH21_00120 [bacterium]